MFNYFLFLPHFHYYLKRYPNMGNMIATPFNRSIFPNIRQDQDKSNV
jgi:hypothetical protein